jgi:hypothetical protein
MISKNEVSKMFWDDDTDVRGYQVAYTSGKPAPMNTKLKKIKPLREDRDNRKKVKKVNVREHFEH